MKRWDMISHHSFFPSSSSCRLTEREIRGRKEEKRKRARVRERERDICLLSSLRHNWCYWRSLINLKFFLHTVILLYYSNKRLVHHASINELPSRHRHDNTFHRAFDYLLARTSSYSSSLSFDEEKKMWRNFFSLFRWSFDLQRIYLLEKIWHLFRLKSCLYHRSAPIKRWSMPIENSSRMNFSQVEWQIRC